MVINIRRGMDVRVPGEPEQVVHAAPEPTRVAVMGSDYPSLHPSTSVEIGDRVARGAPLLVDRRDSAIHIPAPGAGHVVEINRGAKRSVASIVLALDGNAVQRFPTCSDSDLGAIEPDAVRKSLLASGLWASFRVRPGPCVPPSSSRPVEVLVNAMDTEPLAPEPGIAIAEAAEDFERGLTVLSRLAESTVYLCTAPDLELTLPELSNLKPVQFSGPHPAGLPGTHLYYLRRSGVRREDRWLVDYEDVIAMGHLFAAGELPDERIVALAGSGALKPRLLRVRAGADLSTLLHGEVRPGSRIISGSVLAGRETNPATHYLGRFHHQIAVITEPTVPASATGILALEAFERVWPFDPPPLPLLRALLIRDTQMAQALGCMDLEAEDLALCAYVCPAHLDYARALEETRATINQHP